MAGRVGEVGEWASAHLAELVIISPALEHLKVVTKPLEGQGKAKERKWAAKEREWAERRWAAKEREWAATERQCRTARRSLDRGSSSSCAWVHEPRS